MNEIDLEVIYEKETGKKSRREEPDRNAIGRVNYFYEDDYVEWLEKLAMKESDKTIATKDVFSWAERVKMKSPKNPKKYGGLYAELAAKILEIKKVYGV